MELAKFFLILALGGAFGGFVSSIGKNSPILVRIRSTNFDLGAFGAAIIGSAAAIAAFTFTSLLPNQIDFSGINTNDTLRLLGFAIASGYAGLRILDKSAGQIAKDLEIKVEKNYVLERTLTSAGQYYAIKKYALAQRAANEALKQDPRSKEAKIILALATSFLDEGDPAKKQQGYSKAIEILDEVILDDKSSASAYFNRACIKQARGDKLEDVLSDLNSAISNDPVYKRVASEDDDLAALRGNEEFKRLLS